TQGGTTGPAPECTAVGDPCEVTPCCADTVCVDFGTSTSPQLLCTARCGAGSDCLSCCCLPTAEGQGVCVFQDFCDAGVSTCNGGGCSLGGSLCSSSTDCCNGLCADSAAGGSVCFSPCNDPSDCESGCCSAYA